MAKQNDKPTLAEAVERKAAADAAYDVLIKASKQKRTVDAAAEHQKKCRAALCEKRYAAAVTDAVKRNMPLPQKVDMVECQA